MSYPNPLEKALLQWVPNGLWFITCSGTEAFTLSYGELKVVVVDEEEYPDKCLPCHWSRESGHKFVENYPDKSEGTLRYVVFSGHHFGAFHFRHVSESGFGPRYKLRPSDKVISSAETLELRKQIRDIYMEMPICKEIILPETYSAILRPELFRDLERKYFLVGLKISWILFRQHLEEDPVLVSKEKKLHLLRLILLIKNICIIALLANVNVNGPHTLKIICGHFLKIQKHCAIVLVLRHIEQFCDPNYLPNLKANLNSRMGNGIFYRRIA